MVCPNWAIDQPAAVAVVLAVVSEELRRPVRSPIAVAALPVLLLLALPGFVSHRTAP
jgi:hypothetical protein